MQAYSSSPTQSSLISFYRNNVIQPFCLLLYAYSAERSWCVGEQRVNSELRVMVMMIIHLWSFSIPQPRPISLCYIPCCSVSVLLFLSKKRQARRSERLKGSIHSTSNNQPQMLNPLSLANQSRTLNVFYSIAMSIHHGSCAVGSSIRHVNKKVDYWYLPSSIANAIRQWPLNASRRSIAKTPSCTQIPGYKMTLPSRVKQ